MILVSVPTGSCSFFYVLKCSATFGLLSAYTTANGVTIWIITEADRIVTTILLPEEY